MIVWFIWFHETHQFGKLYTSWVLVRTWMSLAAGKGLDGLQCLQGRSRCCRAGWGELNSFWYLFGGKAVTFFFGQVSVSFWDMALSENEVKQQSTIVSGGRRRPIDSWTCIAQQFQWFSIAGLVVISPDIFPQLGWEQISDVTVLGPVHCPSFVNRVSTFNPNSFHPGSTLCKAEVYWHKEPWRTIWLKSHVISWCNSFMTFLGWIWMVFL